MIAPAADSSANETASVGTQHFATSATSEARAFDIYMNDEQVRAYM